MIARRTNLGPLADASPALALENISKRFGNVDALISASLVVRPGTIHALLGENGAGKSTLMRIAYGLVRADGGSVAVQGRVEPFAGARDAIAHGIGMVHQHFTLVPVMTVAENIALGGRGLLDAARLAERVREIAERTGFALDPAARVETLPIGAQQRVEIAKALIRDARVLILDEPTAVLAPAETAELLRWIRAFADAGNAVVLITHKLQEALSVADDVTVLRLGRTVLTGRRDTVTRESLTRAMLGADRALPEDDESTAATAASSSLERPVVYHADRVTVVDAGGVTRVRDASFSIRAGEIVGIAGVEGSGQRELLRVLAGRMQPSSGTVTRPVSVGFVPEDRHHDAVLLERDLAENVALRDAGARRGIIDWRMVRAHTAALMRAFDVRAEDPLVPMRTLSGGNQQKLVLARELQSDVRSSSSRDGIAIVAENPTRGLDVRATLDVRARLRRACMDGAAIVLYSSDLDEVLLLATRVLVMYGGTVVETPLDREEIGRAMLGVA
jgi:general nucleoside transport system ATP-binding protein